MPQAQSPVVQSAGSARCCLPGGGGLRAPRAVKRLSRKQPARHASSTGDHIFLKGIKCEGSLLRRHQISLRQMMQVGRRSTFPSRSHLQSRHAIETARRGYSGYVCFRGPLKALARLPDPLERFLRAAARDRDQDAPGHQKAGGFAVPRSHTLRRKWLRREESLPAERLRVGRTASTKKPLQTRACLPANREAVRNNRSPGFSKKKHATAPRVPARFLSVVLMRPSPASLPRSDGIGCCLGGMTVACSNIGELKHEPTGAAKRQV